MSVRLYVGNLPKETIERQALQDMFAEAGESIATKMIKDRKTGKCRGFAFVTVPTDEMADDFIEKYNGQPFMDSPLKIEKALPRSKGKGPEESAESEAVAATATATVAAPAKSSGRRDNRKKRPAARAQAESKTQPEGIQPDPRWAAELAKLKEMLTAQAAN